MVLSRTRKSKRYILLLIITILFTIGFYYKQNIMQFYDNLCNTILNFTGAQVKTLIVIGASQKVEKLIKTNLGIKEGDSMFKLSTNNLLNNVINIGWIKDVSIHKILPNIIKIQVTERVPISVYYHNKIYTLIDKEGHFIEDVTVNPNLILVSGTNANLNVYKMLQILNQYPKIKKELYSMTYVRQRRWDLLFNNKITVKLPSCTDNVMHKLLTMLEKLLKQSNIQHSVVSIDLRLPDNVIIQGLQKRHKEKGNKNQ